MAEEGEDDSFVRSTERLLELGIDGSVRDRESIRLTIPVFREGEAGFWLVKLKVPDESSTEVLGDNGSCNSVAVLDKDVLIERRGV